MNTYTQEQLNIELLKQKNDAFFTSLIELKNDIRELRNYMIGLYGLAGSLLIACVCKFLFGS